MPAEKYYILIGLIIDDYPPIHRSIGVTPIYDNLQHLEEDFPNADYLEVIADDEEGMAEA